jgi:hypothetical protein
MFSKALIRDLLFSGWQQRFARADAEAPTPESNRCHRARVEPLTSRA